MNRFKINVLAVLSIFIFGMSACKKEDVGPNDKITGTWKISSAVLKDASESIDFWALNNAIYPCTKEITMTFTEDGKYSTFEPSTCVGKDGGSFSLFSKTGTFRLTDNLSLDLIEDDATPYAGKVVFENGKFTWTYVEDFQGASTSLIIIFSKVK